MPEQAARRLAVMCTACGYPSSAFVAGNISGQDDDGLYDLWLVQCEFCEAPSLVRQDEANEAFPVQAWPVGRRVLDSAIPTGLRRDVGEARKCFEAGLFPATAVMVRRVVEGLCADLGAGTGPRHNLRNSLQSLVQSRAIDPRLLEWADGLRLLGNVGAHANDETVTEQDASDALDLVDALLDYVYVFTTRFEQFKGRRPATRNPSSS